MAAKEPTVERRHRLLALELAGMVRPAKEILQWVEDGEGEWVFSRTARALAAAEQAAAERAWDEGYSSGYSHHSKRNPYRKGDV